MKCTSGLTGIVYKTNLSGTDLTCKNVTWKLWPKWAGAWKVFCERLSIHVPVCSSGACRGERFFCTPCWSSCGLWQTVTVGGFSLIKNTEAWALTAGLFRLHTWVPWQHIKTMCQEKNNCQKEISARRSLLRLYPKHLRCLCGFKNSN